MQSNLKTTFRARDDGISSQLIAKQWGVSLYMVTPGGQIPKFWPKMTPNIGIMQITCQFGPFDNAKLPQKCIQDNGGCYFFKINCQTVGVNPIYGNPGGQISIFWPKMTTNIGIMQITYQFGPFDNAK
jgi:hypothetical protein